MKKRSSAEVEPLIKQARLKISQGMAVKDACKAVNINPSMLYHKRHSVSAAPVAPIKRTYSRKPMKLRVTEIVQTEPKMQGFLLFGTTQMLASFMRSYEQA